MSPIAENRAGNLPERPSPNLSGCSNCSRPAQRLLNVRYNLSAGGACGAPEVSAAGEAVHMKKSPAD
jgi:hypothetical protein